MSAFKKVVDALETSADKKDDIKALEKFFQVFLGGPEISGWR